MPLWMYCAGAREGGTKTGQVGGQGWRAAAAAAPKGRGTDQDGGQGVVEEKDTACPAALPKVGEGGEKERK